MTQEEVTTTLVHSHPVAIGIDPTVESRRRYQPIESRRWTQKRAGKVFPHLVDQAAFVDTITISVNSAQRPRLDEIADQKNVGILSRRNNYSRMVTGNWTVTGNPVTILYGKVNRYPRVPPCSVTIRSESMPVTGAQVNKLVESIFPRATDGRVSNVELTFDVSSFSFSDVLRSAVYRAVQTTEFGDEANGRTFYIGSVKSFWFACIYQKREDVLRLELKLRRGFLSSKGLNHPDDLVGLRTLELSKLFSLRRFSHSRITTATNGWPETAQDWCQRSAKKPLWLVNRILSGNGLVADRLLPKSRNQLQLESMQRLLIW